MSADHGSQQRYFPGKFTQYGPTTRQRSQLLTGTEPLNPPSQRLVVVTRWIGRKTCANLPSIYHPLNIGMLFLSVKGSR